MIQRQENNINLFRGIVMNCSFNKSFVFLIYSGLFLCFAFDSIAQSSAGVRADYLFGGQKDLTQGSWNETTQDLEDDWQAEDNTISGGPTFSYVKCSEGLDLRRPLGLMSCDVEDLLSISKPSLLRDLPREKGEFCPSAMGCSGSATSSASARSVTAWFGSTSSSASGNEDEEELSLENDPVVLHYLENEKSIRLKNLSEEEKIQVLNAVDIMMMQDYHAGVADIAENGADEMSRDNNEEPTKSDFEGGGLTPAIDLCRESKIEKRPLVAWGTELKRYEATWYSTNDYNQVVKARTAKGLVVPFVPPSLSYPEVETEESLAESPVARVNTFWQKWAIMLKIPCLPTKVSFLKEQDSSPVIEYRTGNYAW